MEHTLHTLRTLSVTDTGDFAKKDVVPQILLKGKWLLEMGFTPGEKVEITGNPGNLTISRKLVSKTA